MLAAAVDINTIELSFRSSPAARVTEKDVFKFVLIADFSFIFFACSFMLLYTSNKSRVCWVYIQTIIPFTIYKLMDTVYKQTDISVYL